MPTGYIYILQNHSYGRYVVKIGKTTRTPFDRAKEVFHNATGVPEPFDVVFWCKVANCDKAEIHIFEQLDAYRVSKRREFFEIPPAAARMIILRSCTAINMAHGLPTPESWEAISTEIGANPESVPTESFEPWHSNTVEIPLSKIFVQQPAGTSTLSLDQKNRIDVVSIILSEVSPLVNDEWHDSFSRDRNPESEIIIWEAIAKAFITANRKYNLSHGEKFDAYALLLVRSGTPSSKVIRSVKLKELNDAKARSVLACYPLPPRPLSVTMEPLRARTLRVTPMVQSIRDALDVPQERTALSST
ncbi:GIY-YIG nuclease family protein [Paraburkholderia nemoris]|uniref:GIY-YIG nuclease family protein n=1 Tax=Paraburkholderia nemoris TaxID=2793076 RepID=UPI0038BB1C54